MSDNKNQLSTDPLTITTEHPRMREILAAGAREGELTFDSLNQLLGDLAVDENDVEAILDALDRRGVTIADAPAATPILSTQDTQSTLVDKNGVGQTQAKSSDNASKSTHDDLNDVLAALRNLEAAAGIEVSEDDEPGGESGEAQEEDAFRQYMNRMGQIPRVSPEEELFLARQVREGTPEEQIRAKQKLTDANLRLVVSVARAYAGRTSLSFLDIMQEGNIGLMRAIERYDPDRHKKLSSYATWWIRRSIGKALVDHSRSMRLPGHLYDAMQKLNRLRLELEQDLNRQPSRQELAEAAGLTVAQVDEVLRASLRPVSLESPVGEGEDNELGEGVSGDDAETPMAAHSRSELRTRLEELIRILPEREQTILMKRFGLGDYEHSGSQTIEDIAEEMNLSRDRVNQIETRALRKLRRRAQDSGLDMFFDDM